MLEIIDLKIEDSQFTYTIDLKLLNNCKLGVFSKNQKLVQDFLLLVSGINDSISINYNGKKVFDNKKYFRSRIFMDFSSAYLSTIKPEQVSFSIYDTFNKDININDFKQICKELDIRGEVRISNRYEFSKQGITLSNFALLYSLRYPIIIVNNPTLNIHDDKYSNYIYSKMFDRDYEFAILGLNSFNKVVNYLEYILIFDDFGKTRLLNNYDKLLVISSDYSDEKINKYSIFISHDKKRLIIQDILTKEEKKQLKRDKLYFVEITLSEIENYI